MCVWLLLRARNRGAPWLWLQFGALQSSPKVMVSSSHDGEAGLDTARDRVADNGLLDFLHSTLLIC